MANIYIDVQPDGLSWRDWSDAINMVLSDQALPIVDEEHWQIFADEMISTPSFGTRGLPDPFQFTDWQSWAYELINSFYGKVKN